MQAFITKYHGPTNTRGSRISAKCAAGTIYMSYRHELDIEENHIAAAEILRAKLGWDKDFYGRLVTGCIHTGEYVHVMTMGK